MARVTLNLTATFTPAFHELMNAAEAIRARHGEDRAIPWAQKVMEIDFDLFCHVRTSDRPSLRLIQGGA